MILATREPGVDLTRPVAFSDLSKPTAGAAAATM
ncbi:hypothetical protein BMS3Abin02_00607 [bacterium BMS3Abin02]|nr:hypothetical protein BMS3Abin02_00607 [bacterium BMS3Abin02]